MAATKAKRTRGRPERSGGKVKMAVGIRARDEWRDWLQALAKANRMPAPALIDRLLCDFAKREGFPEPPSRL